MPLPEAPREEDVLTLVEAFGIPRSEAVNRLKANGNDVGLASNELLDDPKSTKYRWEESHFNTDREGEANDTGITFNIQGADGLPSASHVQSAAPTRPPSRTNNRSPLGPANATQEDADLARALAESAAESGITPQETGVIDNQPNGTYFGPANRSEYDTEMWAMVPTKANDQVKAADPPSSNRKRDADAPAFLIQTKIHRLGSILSIYSKIPLARNFLLRCGKPAATYGHNSEWWKGHPILRQDVLVKMSTGEDVWGEDAHPDFIEELHRLMAFLDSSERSYASVDSLAETKAIDESFGSWMPDVEDRLFQALLEASANSPGCGIEQMTTTGKIIPATAPSPSQSEPDGQNEEEDNTTSFIFLDIVLDFEGYSWVDTLYDALDHLLWSSALSLDYTFPDDAKTAVLLKPAEVLTIRIGGHGLEKPCEIPAVFYADRYMDSRKELALHFQTQIREIKKALKKLDWAEADRAACAGQICSFNVRGLEQSHDIRDCCQKIIEYVEQLLERQKKAAQWRQFQDQWRNKRPYSMDDLRLLHTWSGPSPFTDDEKADQERWKHIIELCNNKIAETRRALDACGQKRKELTDCLDVIRKRLTCQEDEVDNDLFVFRSDNDAYHPEYWNPSMKYSLRGVATTSEMAYVCVRDVRGSSNPEEDSLIKDQWWKVGYVRSDASPAKSEKVTLDDVLSAAGTDCKHPVLVYASEAALNQEPIPLSDALRMFVKADNRSFQQELAREESSREAQDQSQEAQAQNQPVMGVTAATLSQIPSGGIGKRKHSGGSSVATNGSIRSNLADIELAFDDPEPVDIDLAEPTYPQGDPQSSGLHDAVASLLKQQNEYEAPGQSENDRGKGPQGGKDLDTNTGSPQKKPEMSERKGGTTPFLARPGPPTQSFSDTMELDTDHERQGG